MFKLTIEDDEGKTTVVPLARDEITIGRLEGNTIRLTERNVSRRHARLVRQNGALYIEDLSSFTGVRVNGAKIGSATPLREGDEVQIGDYRLALRGERTTAPITDRPTMPSIPAVAPPPAAPMGTVGGSVAIPTRASVAAMAAQPAVAPAAGARCDFGRHPAAAAGRASAGPCVRPQLSVGDDNAARSGGSQEPAVRRSRWRRRRRRRSRSRRSRRSQPCRAGAQARAAAAQPAPAKPPQQAAAASAAPAARAGGLRRATDDSDPRPGRHRRRSDGDRGRRAAGGDHHRPAGDGVRARSPVGGHRPHGRKRHRAPAPIDLAASRQGRSRRRAPHHRRSAERQRRARQRRGLRAHRAEPR